MLLNRIRKALSISRFLGENIIINKEGVKTFEGTVLKENKNGVYVIKQNVVKYFSFKGWQFNIMEQ